MSEYAIAGMYGTPIVRPLQFRRVIPDNEMMYGVWLCR